VRGGRGVRRRKKEKKSHQRFQYSYSSQGGNKERKKEGNSGRVRGMERVREEKRTARMARLTAPRFRLWDEKEEGQEGGRGGGGLFLPSPKSKKGWTLRFLAPFPAPSRIRGKKEKREKEKGMILPKSLPSADKRN